MDQEKELRFEEMRIQVLKATEQFSVVQTHIDRLDTIMTKLYDLWHETRKRK